MRAMDLSTAIAAAATSRSIIADSFGCFQRESPVEVSSVTRCSTTNAPTALPWGPSTDYYTSTSYVYRQKFQLLTPKAITTSVTATSTYTQYDTAPNNLTKTIWSDTYTYTNYLTTTETVSSTATSITSLFQTTVIPTQVGFVPVVADYPEAKQHFDDSKDEDQWSIDDSYWLDDWTLQQGPEAPESISSDPSLKIECLITIINIYNSGTTSSRLYVPPATYTRTKYISTETTTITVTTKNSPTETPVTYTMASGQEERSWLTETRTNVETLIVTVTPTTTISSYAACATDNVVDTYQGWPLNRLADDWYSKNYTIVRPTWAPNTNATDCCASAAANPHAIFFKYDGGCEVFVENFSPGTYSNTSAKLDVVVLYEPREWSGWGLSVGNGPRGSISFDSLWV